MIDQAIVTSVTRETDDSVVITLAVDEARRSLYQYKQGQSLTLIKEFDGEEVRRSYSICSSVNDQQLRVGIKRIDGGLFSTWANTKLKTGDTLGLLPPAGHFYSDLDQAAHRFYVAVAAGSGITPILSIIKTTLETEAQSEFVLLYGNRTTKSIMFLEELEALKNRFPQRLTLFNILTQETQGSELLSGRINGGKVARFLNGVIDANHIDDVFLCGPFEVVSGAKTAFIEHGVAKERVHTELFGTPEDLKAIEQSAKKPTLSAEERAHISKVRLKVYGKESAFELKRGGESILDAALKIRSELPFACKGGVCATCKAKVVQGEVEMDLNYSLSDDEVAQGFVLTCQSHPVSDDVTVDFDQVS